MIVRTMFLIEHYAINRKNGVWSLIGYSRVDDRVKNLVMKSVKKQGYQYNRGEKAYILETDPVEFCTGWQFIGYNIMAAVVAILLCIKY